MLAVSALAAIVLGQAIGPLTPKPNNDPKAPLLTNTPELGGIVRTATGNDLIPHGAPPGSAIAGPGFPANGTLQADIAGDSDTATKDGFTATASVSGTAKAMFTTGGPANSAAISATFYPNATAATTGSPPKSAETEASASAAANFSGTFTTSVPTYTLGYVQLTLHPDGDATSKVAWDVGMSGLQYTGWIGRMPNLGLIYDWGLSGTDTAGRPFSKNSTNDPSRGGRGGPPVPPEQYQRFGGSMGPFYPANLESDFKASYTATADVSMWPKRATPNGSLSAQITYVPQ